ncbi:rhodanese-like domain-containing protein [Methylomonas koyamae]|uniref:rhodanese-like domain-containing protein n=1 Tax=Methylomonas koyamae TaxID=702114 RepID=UPI000BC2EFAA|nr:rhodanese-like domain-containing protein [Methylomonas koyamae]ATG92419.1 sulfurtransferase [Methylomonas koyamae]WNB75885.1 rhodanese-like domain-containing protein [Methylomonas koyamae]
MIENLDPKQAWDLLQTNPNAVLIDVRTAIEHSFVGHPPKAIHVAWKEFPGMQLNANFVAQVEQHASDKSAPVLLLCRSGQRSVDAAKALEAAGYLHLVNILEGFEGPLDADQHRGNLGGWRFHGLPWSQS